MNPTLLAPSAMDTTLEEKSALPQLLLVEDDPNLGSVLQEFLEMKGFSVIRSMDGATGLITSQQHSFALCILDIMLPKKDGFTLAREIRQLDPLVPIIFLTARGKLEDKLEGFQSGGDDYLTKPFSMEELMVRIKAVMRRSQSDTAEAERRAEQNIFQLGESEFDFNRRILVSGGIEHLLTSREADLLKLLSQHTNSVVRRDVALKLIWGDDSYFNARSMDVFISKLRKYLLADGRVRLMNVHGIGYKLLVE